MVSALGIQNSAAVAQKVAVRCGVQCAHANFCTVIQRYRFTCFFFKKKKGRKEEDVNIINRYFRCTELKSLNLPRTATRKDRRHAKTEPIECLAATQSIQKSVRRWRTGQFCNFPQDINHQQIHTNRYASPC